MKIVFTELNRGWILTLPVTPSNFEWGKRRKTSSLETLKRDIDIIENLELRNYNVSSFIPDKGAIAGKKYPFQITGTPGRDVVKALDFWVENKTGLRMIVTAKDGRTLENVTVKIVAFSKSLDRVGDYVYSLEIFEHVPLSGV